MADYSTLFLLILVALTFVIVGMFFIVYLMLIGERAKNKLRAKMNPSVRVEITRECPHSFGYLSEYPQNEPIPEECFGCPEAIECKNRQEETGNKTETAESPQQ